MMNDQRRPFLDAEEVTNEALHNIGKDVKLEEPEKADDRVAILTVQDLLEQIKTDDFEKLYVTTAAIANTPNMEQIPDDQIEEVKSVAEYQLSKMPLDQEIDEESQKKLQSAANFYMIPRTAEYKFDVGNNRHSQEMKLYTVNDVEGYCLYTVVDENNITISKNARDAIEKYLLETYPDEVKSGTLKVSEIIDDLTPNTLDELYDAVGNDHPFTMRFLPNRVDEIVSKRGIPKKAKQEVLKEPETKEAEIKDEKDKNPTETSIEERQELEEEPQYESYIEKIAKFNNVKPAVVNTRVIENFEKVEEDTGIHLKGKFQRGDVVAVRLPYKLGYRTFLVQKSTGMTIDQNGVLDGKPGKMYNYKEVGDYFRFRLRGGEDGGDGGKPLSKDEGRDYSTYIDKNGEVREEKFVNNGKQKDMLRDERERYLLEVEEIDKKLADAIEEYQKSATHENYEKVRNLVKEKVEVDNKYNALDKQRELTERSIDNIETAINRDLDVNDEKVPWDVGRERW